MTDRTRPMVKWRTKVCIDCDSEEWLSLFSKEKRNKDCRTSRCTNVFGLLKGDMQGVLWTRIDSEEAWEFTLARELKATGFDIALKVMF